MRQGSGKGGIFGAIGLGFLPQGDGFRVATLGIDFQRVQMPHHAGAIATQITAIQLQQLFGGFTLSRRGNHRSQLGYWVIEKTEMPIGIVLDGVDQWPPLCGVGEMVQFGVVATITSQQQVTPEERAFRVSLPGPIVFDVAEADVGDFALAVGAFAMKHRFERFFYFWVAVFIDLFVPITGIDSKA